MYDQLVKKFNDTDTSKLVEKTDCNTKTKEIGARYLTLITLPNKFIIAVDFNKLTKENFEESLKLVGLATESYDDDFIKKMNANEQLRNFNNRVTSNKTKQIDAVKN